MLDLLFDRGHERAGTSTEGDQAVVFYPGFLVDFGPCASDDIVRVFQFQSPSGMQEM